MKEDFVVAKRVLCYLNGTKHFGLWLGTKTNAKEDLVGYSDAHWAGDLVDRTSTSGSLVLVRGVSVYWRSSKRSCVSLLTSAAEFVALTET